MILNKRNQLTCCRALIGTFILAVMLSSRSLEAAPPYGPPTQGVPIRDAEHSFNKYVKSWRTLQRENVVMQERDYSCGAAALATMLRYHWGDDVTEVQVLVEAVKILTKEELKERIENGLSLTDLKRISANLGYLSTIGTLKFQNLSESKIPLVVGIVVNDYNHFVVFRGTDGTWVYLADPARGNIRIPVSDFLQQWQKNAVLVVVKKGVKSERNSPLRLQWEETLLGETNRQLLIDEAATIDGPIPK